MKKLAVKFIRDNAKRVVAVVLALNLLVMSIPMMTIPRASAEAGAISGTDILGPDVLEPEIPEESVTESVDRVSGSDISLPGVSGSDVSASDVSGSDVEDISVTHPAFFGTRWVNGVNVSVGAPVGVFPKDAVLSVTTVSGSVENRVESLIGSEAENSQRYTFDIKVMYEGEEIQPNTEYGEVYVFFRVSDMPDNAEVEVYHINDSVSSAESMGAAVTNNTVEVVTDSFSIFTVEFTYSVYEYVLEGNGTVALSTILETFGLNGEVTYAQSSDDSLFTVQRTAGGDWNVVSLMPFTTEESLFVTIDGREYVITVTDAITDVIRVTVIMMDRAGHRLSDVPVRLSTSQNSAQYFFPNNTGVTDTNGVCVIDVPKSEPTLLTYIDCDMLTPTGGSSGYEFHFSGDATVRTVTNNTPDITAVNLHQIANITQAKVTEGDSAFTFTIYIKAASGYSIAGHSVVYDGNGDGVTGLPANSEIAYNNLGHHKFDIPATIPQRENYEFIGWNNLANGTGVAVAAGQTAVPIVNTTVLYAQWKGKDINVSFDLNAPAGVTAEQPADLTVEYGSTYTGLADPVFTSKNYAFVGWNTEPDGSGTMITADSALASDTDHTLYAQWNEIEGNISVEVYLWDHYGATIDERQNENYPISDIRLAVSAYNQDWSMDKIQSDRVNFGFTAPTDGSGKTSFTLTKEQVELVVENGYVIELNPDGTDSASHHDGVQNCYDWDWETTGTGLRGVRVMVASTLNNAYYNESRNVNHVANLEPEAATEGFSFTVRCYVTPIRVVTFDTNGGRFSNGTVTSSLNFRAYTTNLAQPDPVTVSAPADQPTKANSTFLYWADEDGNEFDFSTPIYENMTLYAKWGVETHVVRWVDGQGNTLKESDEIEIGTDLASLGLTAPAVSVREGYTFTGWDKSIAGTMGSEDIVITAQWKANEYTVTFDANGGSVSPASQTVTYGSAYGTLPVPTKEGHTFTGWKLNGSGITAASVVETAGNHTLVAGWTTNSYSVKWQNWNSALLYEENTPYGTLPEYNGAAPTRPADAQYTYTFTGWDPAISVVKGEVVYTATYSKTVNKYTVTWVDYDGSALETDTAVPYGTTPEYNSAAPSRAADAQYTYTFTGWSPAVDTVKGEVTYTAQYSTTVNEYTVTWKNYDGTLLDTDTVKYGDTPSYTGQTPVKAGNDQYSYTFTGWNPAVAKVTGNAEYTAVFEESTNSYTVTWKNYDGSELDIDVVEYGKAPAYTGEPPVKAGNAQYSYTFTGWNPDIDVVTGNVVYTAQFKETVNTYTVVWKHYDGTTLETDNNVPYGTEPTYNGVQPARAADAQYTYTFAGWTPAVEDVTGDAVYTAAFDGTLRAYNIVWQSESGSIVSQQELDYGTALPSVAGPAKAADAQYTYTFKEWQLVGGHLADDNTVIGDATLAPVYEKTLNTYKVTWVNEDGTVLETDPAVPYGTEPVYDGQTPVKAADVQYTYTFKEWDDKDNKLYDGKVVVCDVTMTATYTPVLNSYDVIWLDEAGNEIGRQTVKYGSAIPTVTEPTKAADAQYTYEFKEWATEDEIGAGNTVVGDVIFTAVFDKTVNEYTVIWQNEDGSEYEKQTVAYGSAIPTVTEPTKAADTQYTYEFKEWQLVSGTEGENDTVTGDLTYKAVFDSTRIAFTVTWLDEDGNQVDQKLVNSGEVIPTVIAPDKAGNAQYSYSFKEWVVEEGIVGTGNTVVGDVTLKAVYNEELNSYTVTWKNGDDTIYSEELAYGTTPAYDSATYGVPAKDSTEDKDYTFAGWTPVISEVTGDVTYTAKFTDSARKYSVTWKNGDTTIYSEELAYGTTPAYDSATYGVPAKDSTVSEDYTFAGWTPEINTVTGTVVYTAKFTATPREYTVTWKNFDGSELGTDTVKYGDTPAYTGETPVKTGNAQYSYTFTGWDPAIEAVTGDAEYTAQFEETVNSYTVTWKNHDGTELGTDTVKYGDVPAYTGETPVKTGNAQYSYTFTGWDPAIEAVTGDAEYTAQFEETVNSYTVTWKNHDGTELGTDTVKYGDTPAYAGETPVKTGNAQYSYTFTGWDPAIEAVTGDAEYTAQFEESVNSYTVTWQNHDGTIYSEELAYGTTPAYDSATYGVPAKDSTEDKDFTFAGWTPVISEVTGDVTYTAKFTDSARKYSVTWKNGDDTIYSEGLAYGTTPAYDSAAYGVPAKDSTVSEDYTFAGWTPEINTVTGTVVYTAKFTAAPREYTVTWKNFDGTELGTDTVEYGDVPAYTGETPVKTGNAQYSYTFTGWDPAIETVTGDAEYTAQFEETVNSYTVTWKNHDGTELDTDTVKYGDTPAYTGETPVKTGNAQYSYSFTGWDPAIETVTGDAEYTAQFEETVNSYTVTWKNGDDTIYSEELAYGTTPAYDSATYGVPAKDSTVSENYTFSGWTPAVEAVTGDASYNADFTASPREYTVTWIDADGSTIYTESVPYGTTPAYDSATYGVPAKDSTEDKDYTFAGWTPVISEVTGDATYTAKFTDSARKYSVTWKNGDDTIYSEELAYGTTPAYDSAAYGVPAKDSTVSEDYTFAGWTPEINTVTGTVVYTAKFTAAPREYTVTWKNHDGTELGTDTVKYGDTPAYTGETPVKTGNVQYSYSFTGWDPAIEAVTGDAEYTAQFEETVNSYTVTWQNGETIYTESVPYGQTPAYDSATYGVPDKASTVSEVYTFAGWTPTVEAVTGDVAYTAQFTASPREYTVTWIDADGSTIYTESVAYGTTPAYDSATYGVPAKDSSVSENYTFSGWTPAVEAVTGDASYNADFTASPREYTVTWIDADGSTIYTESVAYGTTPAYDSATYGVPAKDSTEDKDYTFAGWTPVISEVTGDATYTAKFTDSARKYSVTWKNGDDTIYSEELAYGTTPAYDSAAYGVPAKDSTVSEDYTFAGWNPEINAVTGIVVYSAKFTATPREYTVTWQNDGTIYTESVAYGTTPTYDETTYGVPAKDSTASEVYTFAGWTPAVEAVTGDAAYTAQFTAAPREYTVTWIDEDGNELDSKSIKYGEAVPTVTAPDKIGDAQYSYSFKEWKPIVGELGAGGTVIGKVTLVPVYEQTVNQYDVVWKDYDGTILSTDSVEYGAVPVYNNGEDPAPYEKEGYTVEFTGWTPAVEAVTGDAEYTAQYSETVNKYDVTLNVNGGNALADDKLEVTYGAAYGTLPVPTRTGYTFEGWYLEGSEVTAATAVATAKDHTLTARWSAESGALTFDVNGGDALADDTLDVVYDQPYGALPVPTRTGYTFEGWFVEDKEITADTIVKSVSGETAVAKWTPITYTVSFNSNGGKGSMAKQTFTYGEPAELTANAFTKKGNMFMGWATDPDSNTVVYTDAQEVSDLTANDGENIALYAVWDDAYTVIVQAANYGGSINPTNTMVKAGEDVQITIKPDSTHRITKIVVNKVTYDLSKLTYSDGAYILTLEDVSANTAVFVTYGSRQSIANCAIYMNKKYYEVGNTAHFHVVGSWPDSNAPLEGDRKYVPINWHHDDPSGDFGGIDDPNHIYADKFLCTTPGEFTLYAEFQGYTFVNGQWVADAEMTQLSKVYYVSKKSSGSATTQPTTQPTTSNDGSGQPDGDGFTPDTGEQLKSMVGPTVAFALIGVSALLIIILLLVRRKKNDEEE